MPVEMPQGAAPHRFERRHGVSAPLTPDDRELGAIWAPDEDPRAPVRGQQQLRPAAAIDVHGAVATRAGEGAGPTDAEIREAAARTLWLGRAVPVQERDPAVASEDVGPVRSLARERRHSPHARKRTGRAVVAVDTVVGAPHI